MENSNIDRWLGLFFALFLVVLIIIEILVVVYCTGIWGKLILIFWVSVLGFWGYNGIKKIDVGWRAQLLLLGERMDLYFGEGLRWIPFPFNIKTADCREVVLKLDLIKVFTQDNIELSIDVTIFRKIVDLNLYFGLDEKGLKQGIDDIRDQVIRMEVRDIPLSEALKMHEDLKQKAHAAFQEKSPHWGIEILDVIIAGIEPDSAVIKDLELKEREKLQLEGQKVEIKNFTDRVLELIEKPPKGPGLTREQAIEQAQLSLGKASKTIDAKTFTLDPATIDAIAAILGRIKP